MTMAKRILLVEDSPAHLQLMQDALAGRGYDLLVAEDGERALAQARMHKPDLILLDIVLPKVSGFQVCRQIKSDAELSKIPVIFVSSKTQEFDRYWGLKQGADGYITKPFRPEELAAEVEARLH
jgi:twitching motility two-component system response regulator PilH